MDIATHAMTGVILSAPWMTSHPLAASCFMLGSVAPDLDCLTRVFGASRFLKIHQSLSHSLPSLLALGLFGELILELDGNTIIKEQFNV